MLRLSGGDELTTLREVLRSARLRRKWSLREAERQTGIHNAHLSQIENGTISKPEPNILFALANAYETDYERLLRLAGHITKSASSGRRSPYGAVAWKALTDLSEDQQREVLAYISKLQRDGQSVDSE